MDWYCARRKKSGHRLLVSPRGGQQVLLKIEDETESHSWSESWLLPDVTTGQVPGLAASSQGGEEAARLGCLQERGGRGRGEAVVARDGGGGRAGLRAHLGPEWICEGNMIFDCEYR